MAKILTLINIVLQIAQTENLSEERMVVTYKDEDTGDTYQTITNVSKFDAAQKKIYDNLKSLLKTKADEDSKAIKVRFSEEIKPL